MLASSSSLWAQRLSAADLHHITVNITVTHRRRSPPVSDRRSYERLFLVVYKGREAVQRCPHGHCALTYLVLSCFQGRGQFQQDVRPSGPLRLLKQAPPPPSERQSAGPGTDLQTEDRPDSTLTVSLIRSL